MDQVILLSSTETAPSFPDLLVCMFPKTWLDGLESCMRVYIFNAGLVIHQASGMALLLTKLLRLTNFRKQSTSGPHDDSDGESGQGCQFLAMIDIGYSQYEEHGCN